MGRLLTTLIPLILFLNLSAQVNIYVQLGTNTSTHFYYDGLYIFGKGSQVYVTDNDYQEKGWFRFFSGDILVEAPLNKVIYGVSGISVFQTGYDNSVRSSGGDIFLSELDISYLSVPLLFRVKQFNIMTYDVGFTINYPISAILNETRNKDTLFELSESRDIASFLTPITVGGYFSIGVNVNRYSVSIALQSGQTRVDNRFKNEWPISNGSLFLRDIYPKFSYNMFILKFGIQLK